MPVLRAGEVESDGLASKGYDPYAKGSEYPEAFGKYGIPLKAEDKGAKSLDPYLQLVAENPHTGTSEQIVTLAMGLYSAKSRLEKGTYSLLRDECGFGPKVLSKLQVIGLRMLELSTNRSREMVTQGLPASYSVIHLFCSVFTAQELRGAVKSKTITPKTSVRKAKELTERHRFPRGPKEGIEKGRWGIAEELLFRVCRPEDNDLGEEQQQQLEQQLRKVCSQYGVQLRRGKGGVKTLREEERVQKAAFWRSVLKDELTPRWFQAQEEEWKRKYCFSRVEELWATDLRKFSMCLRALGPSVKGLMGDQYGKGEVTSTEFNERMSPRREAYWQNFGKAYVAKLHYEYETTDSRSNKYNLKRRIEEVFLDRDETKGGKELAIWRNIHLKNAGMTP